MYSKKWNPGDEARQGELQCTGEPTAHTLARCRCFLPDLAGLAGLRRVGPGTPPEYHRPPTRQSEQADLRDPTRLSARGPRERAAYPRYNHRLRPSISFWRFRLALWVLRKTSRCR